MKCSVCRQKGAYVGCAIARCRMAGHFPCLREQGFLFQFFGSFSAFCQKHRPTQPPLDFLSPRRLNCSICVSQVPSAPSFDTLYSPCCKAVLHRECIQKFALSAGSYFFKCPLCNNNNTFVVEMLRMGISIPERDATWESCGQFSDLYEVTKQCSAEVCVCPGGRSSSSKHGKYRFLRCKSCGRYISHFSCSDDHLVQSQECKDCVLALHNTPQGTPASKREAETKTANKLPTTPKIPTPVSARATPTTAALTTMPTTPSNVAQMISCKCAVCEAKRCTGHEAKEDEVDDEAKEDVVDQKGEAVCGGIHRYKSLARDLIESSHLSDTHVSTAVTNGKGRASQPNMLPAAPVRQRKRCLEYPSDSDELRPKSSKVSSTPPRGARNSSPLALSDCSDSVQPALPEGTAVPAATDRTSLTTQSSPSHTGSSSKALQPSTSTSPQAPLLVEIPLSRTLTYHQIMKPKAASCAKHGCRRKV